MKFYALLAMLLITAPSALFAFENGYEGGMPDQCYCSVKCGPRDIKPEDKPFYDPATQRYFCQQRDYDLYLPNQCYVPKRRMQKRVMSRRRVLPVKRAAKTEKAYTSCYEGVPGKCYCSDKCGPRDIKPGDTPFYDEETGHCFCQQRDKDNYEPNGCGVARAKQPKKVRVYRRVIAR